MDLGEKHCAQLVGQLRLFGRITARLQPFDNVRQARMPLLPGFETFTNQHQHGSARARVDRAGDILDLRGNVGRQRNAQARWIACRPVPRDGCGAAHAHIMTHCAARCVIGRDTRCFYSRSSGYNTRHRAA
jgi:hypothetical protein